MSEDVNLPGGSIDELRRIMRAYLSAGEDASPNDVAKRAALNPTQVSRNNRFLLDLGVLEEGARRKKSLSQRGSELVAAMEHQQDSEVKRILRELVEENEFLSQVVSAVRIRGGMDAESLHSHIAYSAGKPKSNAVMTGARAVAALLEEASILEDQDGKYVVAVPEVGRSEEDSHPPSQPTFPQASYGSGKTWSTIADWYDTAVEFPVLQSHPAAQGISINIQIQCSPEDVEELGPKLLQLFSDLSGQKEPLHEGAEDESESDNDRG